LLRKSLTAATRLINTLGDGSLSMLTAFSFLRLHCGPCEVWYDDDAGAGEELCPDWLVIFDDQGFLRMIFLLSSVLIPLG
jgi:hypothetical protein